MNEDAKYPERVSSGDHVMYSLEKNDPEEQWYQGTVRTVQKNQSKIVEHGTYCKFEDERTGYVKDFLKIREFSEKMIHTLLQSTEGKDIERKSSFLIDTETKTKKFWVPDQVTKEVAAFLNTDGGYVIIGQNDAKEVIGISDDLESLKKSLRSGGDLEDKYIKIIETYIYKKLNDTRLEKYITIQIPQILIKGHKLCIIHVKPSENIPAIIDVDVKIIDTRKDHYKERNIDGTPTELSSNEHVWKNTDLKPSFYYVRKNQSSEPIDIRYIFKNNK
jgi:predicted HTH transcriptional regulator